MSEVLGFIPDDGYTEAGVIVAVPGLYPRIEIEFRPMLMQERADYFKGAEQLQGGNLRRFAAGYLKKHLVKWDLRNRKREAVPITVETVMKLKERLFNRLFAIVSTDEAPDIEPDKLPEARDEDAADILRAAETGRTLAEVKEERERKNSPPQ
jgi:hypothetical protein